jgi:tetratricopeptide (TPR) repeat protein
VTAVPSLTVLLFLSVAGGTPDPGALAREVLELSASGDPVRLDRARAAVPDPLRADPAYRGAAAGRAIAGLLAAAELRETSAASPDGAAGLLRARTAQDEALDELRPLVQQAPEDPDVLRALAVYYGLDGRPAEVARLAAQALEAGVAADPWLDFAAVAASLRGQQPSAAEPVLASFVASHPGFHPPRMSLARVRLALGERDRALAALDDLLALDPDHEGAKTLKASLLAPPALERIPAVVPSTAPPPTAPGYLPRKRAARSPAPG